MYEAFKKINFTVHQTKGSFNGLWLDVDLEQTYDYDAKTHLFNGITQHPQTIGKYRKTLLDMISVSEQVKIMVHMNQTDLSNKL